MNHASRTDRERVPGLDGLRALSVMAVLAFHAGQSWAKGGYLGVDSFFVLSGFLITTILLREMAATGGIGLRDFWARRMARLVPALALVAAVVVAIQAARHVDSLSSLRADAASALLYVANWRFLGEHRGYFGQTAEPSMFEHTWSLAIEEQFYLLWPLVLVVLARTSRPRRTVAVFAAVGAAMSALWMVGLAVGGAGSARLYFGTDTRIQAILVGAVLAAWLEPTHDQRTAGSAVHLRRRESRRRTFLLHGVALAGLVATLVLWSRLQGTSPVLFRGGATLAALATAAVIPSVVLLPDGFLGRALGVAPLRALGVISYGVYLWHWPIQLLLTGAATGMRGAPLLLTRAALTVAAAAASYWWLERPIRLRRPARPELRIAWLGTLAVGTASVIVAVSTLSLPVAEPVLAASPSITVVPAPTTTVPGTSSSAARSSTTTTQPPTTTTTRPPLKPTYRTELLGDSVAQSIARGLAPVSAPWGLQVRDDALLGCGVAPTGTYRLRGEEHFVADECVAWASTWSARVASAGAHVAVIQAGRHEVLDRKVDGEWMSILDHPFAVEVARGLDRAIEIAGGTGAKVVVLTAPFYRTGESPDGSPWPENDPHRVNRFNELVRQAAGRHPGSVVVDLGTHTNPGGSYASSVDGVPMRADGVHYSASACSWFASWLIPQLREVAAR